MTEALNVTEARKAVLSDSTLIATDRPGRGAHSEAEEWNRPRDRQMDRHTRGGQTEVKYSVKRE